MGEFIPFSRPDITDAEIQAVTAVLESGWLTTGRIAHELEDRVAEYAGAKHAVALNSCTGALHLALEACGVGRGDVVLTTPYTFAATGEVVRYLGATPVFVDVNPVTGNIDPGQLREAARCMVERESPSANGCLSQGTRRQLVDVLDAGAQLAAIIPVHFAGLACDMDEIMAVGREYEVPVIEDAAHALESSYNGRKIGSIGAASCFSFYATKNLTTGEGGALTTDDKDLADRVRMMSLHGISRDAWNRYSAEGSWRYEILEAGYKYNLTDIAAALGLAQLERIDDMRAKRLAIVEEYRRLLSARCAYLELPPDAPSGSDHAWHLFVVRLREGASVGRDQVIEHLRANEIGSSVHFIPLHLHRYYSEAYGFCGGDFPNAERLFSQVVSLPLYPTLQREEMARIVEALEALEGGQR